MSENIDENSEDRDSSKKETRKLDRSSIEFPYGDLDAAILIAQTLYENAGMKCTTDQMAAFLNMAPRAGGFRAKLAPARTFALIENERGSVELTDLGSRIIDPSSAMSAKIESFLNVPLYEAIYEKYRGHLLPPTTGLEREIQNLGVAPKQTSKARQVFERSAEQAGFFDQGKDRLVMPISPSVGSPKPVVQEVVTPAAGHENGRTDAYASDLHPFIEGLLKTLPEPETKWSQKNRQKWLQAASNIFDLIYTEEDQSSSPPTSTEDEEDTISW